MGAQDDAQDLVPEQVINEEYKEWKKNSPYLYDLCITVAMEWPSLTVEWVPGAIDKNHYDLILGTHTSDAESNHVLRCRARLPDGADPNGEVPGGNVEVIQKLYHEGEVNRARCMPQKRSVVATKTAGPDVLVFDLAAHADAPPAPATSAPVCAPRMRLKGHSQEGYGLSWSPLLEGQLLSAADDQTICQWDTARHSGVAGASLDALATHSGHDGAVEDVAWYPANAHLFGSVGDDKRLCLWDTRRTSKQGAPHSVEAHTAEVNALSFSPFNDHLVATCSSDSTVALFDLRNLGRKLHSFEGHGDAVYGVAWSPHFETVLASSGVDRRIHVWDLARIGEELSAEDAESAAAPAELLFVHGGHTSKISDFSWCPNVPWVIASVSEDNVVQVWKMNEAVREQGVVAPNGEAMAS